MYASDTAAWGAPCRHSNGTNCKKKGIYVREMYVVQKGACEVELPYCQGDFTQFLHSFMKSVILPS